MSYPCFEFLENSQNAVLLQQEGLQFQIETQSLWRHTAVDTMQIYKKKKKKANLKTFVLGFKKMFSKRSTRLRCTLYQSFNTCTQFICLHIYAFTYAYLYVQYNITILHTCVYSMSMDCTLQHTASTQQRHKNYTHSCMLATLVQ